MWHGKDETDNTAWKKDITVTLITILMVSTIFHNNKGGYKKTNSSNCIVS